MAKEQSVFDERFLNTVREWFAARQDIFVVARYSAMAGAREYFWFKDFDRFRARLEQFPPRTDVCVFREDQFPLRGIVDNDLIQRVLALIPDRTEAMVADRIEPPDTSQYVWPCDTHAELIEVLDDLRGEPAAIGPYATWRLPDSDTMISALVPLPDGTLERGVY